MPVKNIEIVKKTTVLLIAGLCMLGTGCKHTPEFKIEGEIYGGEGKSVVLEKADYAGRWIPVDSTRIGRNGNFKIESAAPASPEIYRLMLGQGLIYFPIDSIETLRLETSAENFGTEYTLKGTNQAEQLGAFEKDVLQFMADKGADKEQFKRSVYTKYIQDSQGSILSYYVLTKIINGKPLFDPENDGDTRYYAAVATQFDQYKPDDPHGKMVKEASIAGMRRRNAAAGRQSVIEAPELQYIEIELNDESGNPVKLSDVLKISGKTVVVFAMMNAPESPAFNRELSELRNRKGIAYYHISVDNDIYPWREAARNLPWVTVQDPGGVTSTAMRDYNVGNLPAFYIYDGGGNLIDSAFSLKELESKL